MLSMSAADLSLQEIVQQLGGSIVGESSTIITRVGSLAFAQTGAISFFTDTKYTSQLNNTTASAVIIKPEHAELTKLPKIITDNPYAYFAKLSQLLNPEYVAITGLHATAVIDESVKLPADCSVGANVVIEANAIIGNYVTIGAGCVIEHHVTIGDHTVLEANVTVKHGSYIGRNCHLFSGCVIGNDGFGYAEESLSDNSKRWVKIPQIGRVVIHNHVDIGANTTIDRGAIDDTVIEEGVKLDNLIQIAHNCRIGAHTVIAGCVGIAGSAVIGKHCKIGGAAMILGHLTITDDVTISPGSMIMRSIHKAGTYTALMPFQEHDVWLKTAANIRHLSQLTDKIKTLEEAVEKLTSQSQE
ncbi:MAG: UDP-3-O-(3-hydroxymyristoyl)glucosamine N-acyltransferase [Pseudomonadota bacterium]